MKSKVKNVKMTPVSMAVYFFPATISCTGEVTDSRQRIGINQGYCFVKYHKARGSKTVIRMIAHEFKVHRQGS